MKKELNQKINSKNLYRAFEFMNKKKYNEAENEIMKGLQSAESESDKLLSGLYYSTLGILYKLKKEFRKAWKYYEKAEKLIPDDPALRIISARLLIEHFAQFDTAIKKMEKVIQAVGDDLSYLHPAYSIQGFAWLKKGNKKKAGECLLKSMGENFEGLQTAANLDFKLVGEMLQKKIEDSLCREFLEKARLFSKKTREKPYEILLDRMLNQTNNS